MFGKSEQLPQFFHNRRPGRARATGEVPACNSSGSGWMNPPGIHALVILATQKPDTTVFHRPIWTSFALSGQPLFCPPCLTQGLHAVRAGCFAGRTGCYFFPWESFRCSSPLAKTEYEKISYLTRKKYDSFSWIIFSYLDKLEF